MGEIIHQDGQDYIFGRGAIDDKHSVVFLLHLFLLPLLTFSFLTKTRRISHILHWRQKHTCSPFKGVMLQVGILQALEVILSDGGQPKRTLYVAFGHDEEVGLVAKKMPVSTLYSLYLLVPR